jgi:ABC-type transport system involved in multi-copper enzyme maturation permease subunit
MIKAIITVTFLEGLRNKAVYGISLMAGLMMAFTVVLSGMIMRDVGKVSTDLALSTATFASLMVVLFVGITILARDMERKTVYLALSRAVPRSSYILARFLGLGCVLLMIVGLLLVVSLATLILLKQMYGSYFGTVSFGMVAVAHLFVFLQMLLLTALSVLFSMVASSPFVTFMLTTISWLIGSSTHEVKQLIESANSSQIAPMTRLIVKIAYYVFPDFTLFDLKSVAAHGLPVSLTKLGFSLVYVVFYCVAVLSLTIFLFKRKELT